MRTPSAAALLALLPSALAIPVSADSPSLDVTLSQVGNTRVKAVVKNVGSEDVTFVHLNFFKDSAPVKKVSLFRDSSEVAFEGVKKRFRAKGLTKDALTSLAPGAVIEDEFDIASTSDLTKGGSITVRTSGRVPTAKNSAIVGSIPYSSNELTITVDGAEAAKVAHATKNIVKRTKMTECSGEKQSALETALKNSADLATKAATAAESGDDARFKEYFMTTDAQTRSTVVERLQAVAKESSSTTSGGTSYYCEDTLGYCEPNVLAWTLPSQNIIANCDIYYSELPPLASGCHDQDQATTTLHEFTHAPGAYSPGTDDLGYGYDAATALSAEEALNNADTYALFANAVQLDC